MKTFKTTLALILACILTTACGSKKSNIDPVEFDIDVYETYSDIEIASDSLMSVADSIIRIYNETSELVEAETMQNIIDELQNESIMFTWYEKAYDEPELIFLRKDPALSQTIETTYLYYRPMYDTNGEIIPDEYDKDYLSMDVTFDNSEELEKLTAYNVGRRLAVFVNGTLTFAPWITQKIKGGQIEVIIPVAMASDIIPEKQLNKILND